MKKQETVFAKTIILSLGILLTALGIAGFFVSGFGFVMFIASYGSDKAVIFLLFALPTLVLSFISFFLGRWIKKIGSRTVVIADEGRNI